MSEDMMSEDMADSTKLTGAGIAFEMAATAVLLKALDIRDDKGIDSPAFIAAVIGASLIAIIGGVILLGGRVCAEAEDREFSHDQMTGAMGK